MSVASVAQLLQEQGGGGGGSVNDVIGGTGITVTFDTFGDYTVDNDGVLDLTAGSGIEITETAGNYTITNTGGGGGAVSSIIAGTGITIEPTSGVGDVTITSDVNPTDYYTSTQADGLFQTLTDMANYYTSTQADGIFQTLTDMANYLTTANANTTFQTLTDMANYLTTANANATFQPIGNYLSSPSVSSIQCFTLTSANNNYLPFTMPVSSFYAVTYQFPSLPYNQNNLVFVTPIFSNISEAGATFQRYTAGEIQGGIPTSGTTGQIDFLNQNAAKTAILVEIFVLIVTPS
ncbi:hypothetical protein OAA60_06630 [Porticoccaceae bacterium]|nr:hypothetical protein [Porticoccaceae bacterium]